jgi:hypothetical protein
VPNRDFGQKVTTEKAKCMVMSRRQNAGQNHNILIVNKAFEKFKILGTTGKQTGNEFSKKLRQD